MELAGAAIAWERVSPLFHAARLLANRGRELDPHLPADIGPISTSSPELGGFWTFPTVGLRDADGRNESIEKREDHITRGYLPHRLVEVVHGSVSVTLRRPKVATGLHGSMRHQPCATGGSTRIKHFGKNQHPPLLEPMPFQ
jgi:hypothetical protein